MPFPLDPTFQLTGPPFLTAPDGTTVADQGGTEVDLTGVPLTVAPQSNAVQAGTSATIAAFVAGVLTVTGLTNMAPGSVGRILLLDGTNPGNRGFFPITAVLSSIAVQVADAGGVAPDTNSGAAATISAFAGTTVTLTGLTGMRLADVGRDITLSGCGTPANNGTFPISAFIDPTSVQITNAAGVFPDANSGAISWTEDVIPVSWIEAIDPAAFPPGDPLSTLVDEIVPLNYMQATFGPPRGGGSAILPVNAEVDAPVGQPTGENDPVLPTAGTRGPFSYVDPQQPVRLQPTAELTVNLDPNSLAFGQAPVMTDGPAVRPPEVLIRVPEPGAVPSAPTPSDGGIIYGDLNKVVFS
jgi:hypothetical protein